MRIRQRCRRRLPHTLCGYDLHIDLKKWALWLLFLTFIHGDAWLPPRAMRTPWRTSAPYKSTYASPRTSLFEPHILLSSRKNEDDRQRLEEDIVKRIHLSKENVKRGKPKEDHKSLEDDIAKRLDLSSSNKDKAISALSQPNSSKKRNRKWNERTTIKRNRTGLLPPLSEPKRKSKTSSFSSLLPPPLPNLKSEESFSSGLSSWEEFLGRADSNIDEKRLLPKPQEKSAKEKDDELQLPSISDLFPLDSTKKESSRSSSQSLDGVLPVSELFYRSSQALSGEDEEKKKLLEEEEEGDDEELPFSAEQSDELTTDGNKVRIRRNRAAQKTKKTPKPKKSRGRKLVRRGMEMFLGGTPINADPPQRSVELTYRVMEEDADWKSVITLNTRDFGPLLHAGSADSVSRIELGLYCEYFVSAAMKWDICPKDLREIVKSHMLKQHSEASSKTQTELVEQSDSQPITSSAVTIEMASVDAPSETDALNKKPSLLYNADEDVSILSLLRNIDDEDDKTAQAPTLASDSFTQERRNSTPKGFGKKPGKSHVGPKNLAEQRWRMVGFTLKFSIAVSRTDLESGGSGEAGTIMRAVLTRGITTVLKSKLDGLIVRINKLKLQEGDEGATTVIIEFSLDGKGDVTQEDIEKRAARIDTALGQAMDDGDFSLALAAAAREEPAWPEEVRDRVVEEFLMEDDDMGPWEEPVAEGGDGSQRKKSSETPSMSTQEAAVNKEGPFGTSDSPMYSEDDLFLGGGNGGVFFDYSESNAANSPFKGELGPLLVDAVTTRAMQRHPHVIAIGDVHGCIDELQDLLRLCDYRPGDLVVFLGDLVSKGPDSVAVVQMAREIGALAVRGNHDFEVIRWHQAIKSGVKDAKIWFLTNS